MHRRSTDITRGVSPRGAAALLLALLPIVPGLARAEQGAPPSANGAALWHQSLAAQRLPDMRTQVTLETTMSSGDVITLQLHTVGKLAEDGVNRMLMGRVTSGGGTLLGTSFLSQEHLASPDDLWIYLPALGHPKRITSSNLGDSFMGSEFTFGDLIQPEPDAYDVIVREYPETAAGEACWVIEAKPRERSLERGTGVSREVRWLAQKDLLERKIEQYDRRGQLAKVTDVQKWTSYGEPIRWLALERHIRNVRTGASSAAVFADVRVNTGMSLALFEAHSLAERSW